MNGPNGPSVEPSEPEKEQQMMDSVIELLKEGSTPRVIGINQVRDFLRGAGLDVDEDGFIVDMETGEYVEPYAYSRDAFKEIPSPVDDPLSAYSRPESECGAEVIGAKEPLHLSDMHTAYMFDGEAHPVRDDTMTLKYQLAETGMSYSVVCAWSDSVDILEEAEAPLVDFSALEGEFDIELNCFECGYEGVPDSWEEDEECERGTLRCPECSCLWEVFSIEVCTACQTSHRWEDVTPDDEGEDAGSAMYWEPSCPECGAGPNFLEGQDRYNIEKYEE